LELTVFFSGAFVMAYEMLASRILGPYLGTSIQVWTIIIGVFLLSLSLGYVLGGKIADQKPHSSLLGKIIMTASILIILSGFVYRDILMFISNTFPVITASVFSTLLLFAFPSFLLGMVSPFAVKLKLRNLTNAGSTVGTLYSISTFGSILGTILTGFYLIPHFAVSTIIIGLSVSLLLISLGLFIQK
jgi:predicted membrane-bound spermidine synthase